MKEYTVKVYNDRTEWYNKEGQLHRENAPAIEYTNGNKYWYINGQYHREDGPAVEHANGYKAWYLNGQRHRTDGYAIEWPDGTNSWFVNGQELTEQEFNQRTNKFIKIDGVCYSIETLRSLIKKATS